MGVLKVDGASMNALSTTRAFFKNFSLVGILYQEGRSHARVVTIAYMSRNILQSRSLVGALHHVHCPIIGGFRGGAGGAHRAPPPFVR